MPASAEQIAEAKEHFRIDTEITNAEVKHIPLDEEEVTENTANMFFGQINSLESTGNGYKVILVWTDESDPIEINDPNEVLVDGMPPKTTPTEEGEPE